MSEYYQCGRISVAFELKRFVDERVLPDTGLASLPFWEGFADLVEEFTLRNRVLMAERERLQAELDAWHAARPGPIRDVPAYRHFLESIGYLQPVPAAVTIKTCNRTRKSATRQVCNWWRRRTICRARPLPPTLAGRRCTKR